ncbi:MAG: hypothetical protein ABIW82_03945 [Dokdonella sp.]
MRNLTASPGCRPIAGIGIKAVSAIVLVALYALPWSDSVALAGAPAIDFHVISAGGQTQTNSCFHLSGTVGQVAPGYSNNATHSVFAGFWAAASSTEVDEIFFNGFEDC